MKTDFSNCLTATERMKVPFHDVDPAHVVWHGHYFKYFEVVRCSLLDQFDYSYQAMMDSGYVWPVVDSTVRFVRPLIFDQEFSVTACLREWELRIVCDYKIEDDAGVLYTKGQTVQVPLDMETLEMRFGSPEQLIKNVEAKLAELS
jgi:acyl-CoA thioester hydrolase